MGKIVDKKEKVYELKKIHVEIAWKNRKEIKEGVTLSAENSDPRTVKSFDSLEEARAELEKYKTSITELSGNAGKYFLVEECYIEEALYDEDGDFESGNILEFSKMSIELGDFK